MGKIESIFLLFLVSNHYLDRTISKQHAEILVNTVVTLFIFVRVYSFQFLVVEKLFQKSVKWHFKHFCRNFLLRDDELLASVTEKIYTHFLNPAVVFNYFLRWLTSLIVFHVLNLNTTLGVIVVISVFNPFDAAAWILAISKTLSCHVFEFPKKSFVFICVVKLDFDTFRLTTHIFDSLFNILFSLNHLSNVWGAKTLHIFIKIHARLYNIFFWDIFICIN